ncbi:hypothetical protein [Streptomyces nanshensis]|uniref:Uncharacterized protein n=1 Tax=Streptomyces nanshensis TaxID=518642 RepID=A0A1E7L9F5_9ACTN|nr:hypothetical protein [Streptomyces nanshensis]OEV12826.1 hypothetical protein AN218_06330 [Streptomyces nanshensis]
MNGPAPAPGKRPFTLVVCTDCRDSADEQVVERLRQAVSRCPHGVMVATRCLSALLRCHRSRGLHAAVQPCGEDREPTGVVKRLGPITTEADAEAVAAWLLAGMPDDDPVPAGLRAGPSPQHVAHLN